MENRCGIPPPVSSQSGNPTSYYNGTRWSMTWENGRELTKAVSTDHTITYSYDGDGVRQTKTVNGVKHEYVYASDKLLRETYGTTVLDFLYDQSGNPYAMIYNGTPYYYILNIQGDVVRLMSASGVSCGVYRYDAWGNITYMSDSEIANANPLRYRGYYYDTESGFYYLQSRYYDPEIGRFLNHDKVFDYDAGFPGYNLFVYCGNDPVNRIDISGADSADIDGNGEDMLDDKLLKDGGSGNGMPTAAGQSYSSFPQLKNAVGSPGEGKHWHHIVEQCQIQKSGFEIGQIHNTNNIIAIDSSTHAKLSGFYSSKQSFTEGLTVRNWLAGQSFAAQYKFGMNYINKQLI